MAFTSGTKLGPYVIESPLGAAGMGEVYCARDGDGVVLPISKFVTSITGSEAFYRYFLLNLL
jgi:hypothetical protein